MHALSSKETNCRDYYCRRNLNTNCNLAVNLSNMRAVEISIHTYDYTQFFMYICAYVPCI